MLIAKKRHWIEIIMHIACWVAVFYTLNSLTNSQIRIKVGVNGVVQEQHYSHSLGSYSFLVLALMMLLFYSNIFWLLKKVIRLRTIFWRILIMAAWFLFIFAANYFIVGWLVKWSVPTVPNMPTGVNLGKELGGWKHSQLIVLLQFLAISGISIAYFFLREWAKNELRHNQTQAQQLDTEIKFLKSQISPHFLFNTLNNLYSMAQKKGDDEVADGIFKLSGMMRYMLYESNAAQVSLQKEIESLQNCIVLNKLRFEEHEVRVTFTYPEEAESIFVAPMIFISFVENAFKHGVRIGLSSTIRIAISYSNGELWFMCQNTLHNAIKRMEHESQGIGLENVKRRLELVYPGKHTLAISEADKQYNVELKIKLA